MKILLTGIPGQVGSELRQSLSHLGRVIAVSQHDVDLTDTDAVVSLIDDVRPNVIVNPAAYTAVDKAEDEEELAFAVNRKAPSVLAEMCKKIGALLIHYSTDYVYDGEGSLPYKENDAGNPLNIYGRSKLAGDEAIKASGCDYLILRTSWVYGFHGHNFVKTMLKLADTLSELRIVDDQIGSPTSARTLADVTALLLSRGLNDLREKKGIYHLTNTGFTSWYEFACEIFRIKNIQIKVDPVPSEFYKTKAKRPKNSRVSLDKLNDTFGIIPADWRESLKWFLSIQV